MCSSTCARPAALGHWQAPGNANTRCVRQDRDERIVGQQRLFLNFIPSLVASRIGSSASELRYSLFHHSNVLAEPSSVDFGTCTPIRFVPSAGCKVQDTTIAVVRWAVIRLIASLCAYGDGCGWAMMRTEIFPSNRREKGRRTRDRVKSRANQGPHFQHSG